jgi:hypothetical protein
MMDEAYALKLVTENERLNSLKLRELEALQKTQSYLRAGNSPAFVIAYLAGKIAEFIAED